MKKINNKISKNSIIAKVIEDYPEVIEVLSIDYGMGCVGCKAAGGETIEQGASVHGMSDDDIDKMVAQINKKISK